MNRAEKLALLEAIDEKIKRESEKSLHAFLKHYVWQTLQPGTPFVDNWHIHAICEHLEAVHRGEILRLVISLPFRMLKSTIVSQAFPAWEWIAKPHLQYLTASYSKDIATRDAVDSRKVIESQAYQQAWASKFKLTSDQNVKTRFENNFKGTRVVTSTDAAGTGFGGNRVIIDDPLSALQADSEAARTSSIEWYKGTASTRLNDASKDAIVMTHQRLNQNDLTGYILAEETGWDHLVLPMRFDPQNRKTTSLGFFDPRSTKGELLSPQRLDEATVKTMEQRLGVYHTAAQLQQDPTSREGSIFKVKFWKYFHVPIWQMAAEMDEIIWSWDCTFKDASTSDFVSGLCIGRKGADKYLLGRVNDRMSFTQTKFRLVNERVRFEKQTTAVLVEDKANGTAIVDALKSEVPALIAVTPQGGKIARANAVQPQHESGNFYLPSPKLEGCAWVLDFVDVFARFPGVKNDDDVDAWTQGVNWFMSREGYEAPSAAPAVGGSRTFR